MPDPQDPETFRRSKLDWSERSTGGHARLLAFYRELIALRRSTPDLRDGDLCRTGATWDHEARRLDVRRGDHRVLVNLGEKPWETSGVGSVLLFWGPVETGSPGLVPARSAVIVAP